jgi:hypothetical protein
MTTYEQLAGDGDDRNESPVENVSSSGLMDAPVAPVRRGDIDENVIPPEDKPVARIETASIQLRRWVVAGVGGLIGMVLLLSPMIVILRPEATNFAASYMQTGLAGLFGIGGAVVAYLFTRERP